MGEFFAYEPSAARELTTFSVAHLVPLLAIVLGVALLAAYRKQLRMFRYERWVGIAIASLAIGLEVSFQIWQMAHGRWDFAESLPLHLCRLTSYLGIYTILSGNHKVFEIAYFWSLAGVVSVLFPDIQHGVDRFRYWHFMLSHMLFFYLYMYLLFVRGMPLTFHSFRKSFLTLLGLALFVIVPVNLLFDMNYMYLREPGDTPFVIFAGHGYPLYLMGCIGLVMVVITLWYLPIHLYNRTKANPV
jgi:hypothetical integral membrane protein (TIGR02206 family)